MKKLLQGIVDFRKGLTEESRSLFAKLALGQKPDALFIGCSDSRVAPNIFASTNPGDLFVVRNIGNLIPPATSFPEEACVAAAIEFSVNSLNVSDIIVCGHSECGAIQALVEGANSQCCAHLKSWLTHAENSLKMFMDGFTLNPNLSKINQISQLNVLEQMKHIATYPCVQERLVSKQIRIHGWWFDIAQADVYCYEQALNQYVLIDELEAKLIFQRLIPRAGYTSK